MLTWKTEDSGHGESSSSEKPRGNLPRTRPQRRVTPQSSQEGAQSCYRSHPSPQHPDGPPHCASRTGEQQCCGRRLARCSPVCLHDGELRPWRQQEPEGAHRGSEGNYSGVRLAHAQFEINGLVIIHNVSMSIMEDNLGNSKNRRL